MKEIVDGEGRIEKVCTKCGRSSDLEHEEYVAKKSLKEYRNLQSYSGTSWKVRRALSQFFLEKGESV